VFAAVAVEFFIGLTRRQQRKLLDRVHELAADPFLVPDFHSTDKPGRDVSHLMVGGFIFDYWVDDAVKQVVIVSVEFVE